MATAGRNTKLNESERQKLFAYHFRKELASEAKRREAAAEKTANRKVAKAADPTFTSQKFDHYLKAHFGEDEQKPVERLKSDRENLEWLGLIPATTGGDLLAQADRVDREQLIQAKGYKAGLLNLDRVSGYDAGSADDKLWLASYDAGKQEYETEIPDIMARIEAAASKEEPPSDDDPFPDAETMH
ncbi:hypothetical protein GOZ89_09670 [Agrobacterium vitis]|uniref:hypothetical protein n=1 Tax=Agrobacterium vitis TaxID=373 RepID=UPI0012E9864A|nr:hypothetical protein [Agrobacterium vitis]MCF1468466.1 hypothetical protein [Agrobacterium vitis]MVA79685.1 hypothetical protein [Agrobacterium vitis]